MAPRKSRIEIRKETAAAMGYLLDRLPRGAHTVTAVVNAFKAATPVLRGMYPTITAAEEADIVDAIAKHVKVQGTGKGKHIILR